jgi:hypothetical protein
LAKLTDAIVVALKGYFETGDAPTEAQFITLINAIQEGIEEHDHAGLGDGDAANVVNAWIANDTIAYTKAGAGLPQLYRRQGGDANNWHVAGVVDTTIDPVNIQIGCVDVTGGAATVTFPTPFGYIPLVYVCGARPSGTPAPCRIAVVDTITVSAFTVRLYDAAGAAASGSVNWQAIGHGPA